MNILSETSIDNNNIFEIIKKIEDLKIISSKSDILKVPEITLTLYTNNNEIFNIMNISFNTLELFNNFKFKTDLDSCMITGSVYDWMILIKTIIKVWSYDSNLLAMFIIKVSDFINQEFNNYKLIHKIQSTLNIYEEYFNITNELYEKYNKLNGKLNTIFGRVSLAKTNLKVIKYKINDLNDLKEIFDKTNFNNVIYAINNNNLITIERLYL